MAERYANDFETTVVGSMNNSDVTTAITLAASLPTELQGTGWNARIDNEFVRVTTYTNPTSITVTRASEDSTRFPKASHSAGATFSHVITMGTDPSGTSGGLKTIITEPYQLTISKASSGKDQIVISDTTAGAGLTIGGDTNLYRSAANVLQTDDTLIIYPSATDTYGLYVYTSGTTIASKMAQFYGASTVTSSNVRGVDTSLVANPGSASTAAYYANWSEAATHASAGANLASASLTAFYGLATNNSTSGTVGSLTSFKTYSVFGPTGGATSSVFGLYAQTPVRGGTGTLTSSYGIFVENQGATGITNAYGLYLNETTGAATVNRTIYLGGSSGAASSGITFYDTAANLYRSATNILKTDATFHSALNIYSAVGTAQQVMVGNYGAVAAVTLDDGSIGGVNYIKSTNANLLQTNATFVTQVGGYQVSIGDYGSQAGISFMNDASFRRASAASIWTESKLSFYNTGAAGGIALSGGSAGAYDVSLYASAANTLATDDNVLITTPATTGNGLAVVASSLTSGTAFRVDSSASGNSVANVLSHTATATSGQLWGVSLSSIGYINPGGTSTANYYGNYHGLSVTTAPSDRITGYVYGLQGVADNSSASGTTPAGYYIGNAGRFTSSNVGKMILGAALNAQGPYITGGAFSVVVGLAVDSMFNTASATSTTGGYVADGITITLPSQGGNTSGTNTNRGIYINGTGGTAGVGGTVNNYGIYIDSTPAATSGAINWSGDTNLYRASANILTTDDTFNVGKTDGTLAAPQIRIQNGGGSGTNAAMRAYTWSTYYADFGYDFTGSDAAFVNSVTNNTIGAFAIKANGTEYARFTNVSSIDAGGLIIGNASALGGAGSGVDGNYKEVFRTQIAGSLGTSNWRHSIYSTLSTTTTNSKLKFSLANAQATQLDVMELVATGRLNLPVTGSAAGIMIGGDANLYRNSAQTLRTDGAINIYGYNDGANQLWVRNSASQGANNTVWATYAGAQMAAISSNGSFVTNTAIYVDQSDAGGQIVFGSLGDTNLYRSAANTLTTDDNFKIIAPSAGSVPFTIKAAAAQSADITQWTDSSNNVLARMEKFTVSSVPYYQEEIIFRGHLGRKNPYNPFGDYIYSMDAKTDNALFLADKRFTVTLTSGSWSAGSTASVFNGNWEDNAQVAVSGTVVLKIDLTAWRGGSGFSYPEGWIYITFYYTNVPASVSARVQSLANYPSGSWTAAGTAVNISNNASYAVYRIPVFGGGFNNLAQMEVTINANGSNTAAVTQIEYYSARATDTPVSGVTKYAAETLYQPLTLQSTATGNIPLYVKGITSQTANLQEWQSSASAVLASVNSVGHGSFPSFQIGSASHFDYLQAFSYGYYHDLTGSGSQRVWRYSGGSNIGMVLYTNILTVGGGNYDSSGARLGQTLGTTVSGATYGGMALANYSSGQAYTAPIIDFNRSRHNTLGSHTIVQDGDTLGLIIFRGSNGTTFDEAAQIRGFVDGTPGASADMPGRLSFYTSSEASATPTERVRITSGGNVVLNSSNSALSTSATTGFTFIPTTAGTPSGTPSPTYTGAAPMVVDSTNNILYIYLNGGWKGVELT